MSIRTQGIHGTGRRDFTPAQEMAVVAAIIGGAKNVEAVTARTGVAGRTVREIVSAADGNHFCLGGSGNGYALANDATEAQRLTARLQSQVNRMQSRIDRRLAFAQRLV